MARRPVLQMSVDSANGELKSRKKLFTSNNGGSGGTTFGLADNLNPSQKVAAKIGKLLFRHTHLESSTRRSTNGFSFGFSRIFTSFTSGLQLQNDEIFRFFLLG
jgi:hypothetical protein